MTTRRDGVLQAFEFEDAGRTFVCTSEPLRSSSPETWWWFKVSTDPQTRHSAFQSNPGDTEKSVQSRIVLFWDDLLARRAAPTVNRWKRGPQLATPSSTPAVAETPPPTTTP